MYNLYVFLIGLIRKRSASPVVDAVGSVFRDNTHSIDRFNTSRHAIQNYNLTPGTSLILQFDCNT